MTWDWIAGRLAMGAVLIEPTTNRETGYLRLRDFIKSAVPTGEVTDFMYQVNHPRDTITGIQGLRINCLAKWSVSVFQLIAVSAGMHTAAPPHSFVNLELDISTSGDRADTIPPNQIIAVLDDLQVAAAEIADGVVH